MIQKVDTSHIPAAAVLASRLWPGQSQAAFEEEFASLLTDSRSSLFLSFQEAKAVGFAQCQLRQDYVEGTDSSPVGYLEGIYVLPEHRHQGHAKALLAACEEWARSCGCREFASDCPLENTQSLSFHMHTGFSEANRIICFVKKL